MKARGISAETLRAAGVGADLRSFAPAAGYGRGASTEDVLSMTLTLTGR